LSRGRATIARGATGLRAAAVTLTASISWLAFAATTWAASPSPEPGVGDPRSSGQGPGLVGDPAFALAAVIAIGLASLLATLVYVRLTARRGD
jgi:hypothetical protein